MSYPLSDEVLAETHQAIAMHHDNLRILHQDLVKHYQTLANEQTPVIEEPLWYKLAKAEIGVKEIRGSRDNPRIVEYHSVTRAGPAPDEIPWCASFVCWCLHMAARSSTRSKAARSFLSWGSVLLQPKPGCIVVLNRGSGSSDPTVTSGPGHVGFYAGPGRPGTILVLGGNQRNAVSIREYPQSDVLAYRWIDG